MTPIDVRIKYKADTGFAATLNRTYERGYDNEDIHTWDHTGRLTQRYAQWLERNVRINEPQMSYQRDTGCAAVFLNSYDIIQYKDSYKEWLEEKYIETH